MSLMSHPFWRLQFLENVLYVIMYHDEGTQKAMHDTSHCGY